jgi:hypothetical protein
MHPSSPPSEHRIPPSTDSILSGDVPSAQVERRQRIIPLLVAGPVAWHPLMIVAVLAGLYILGCYHWVRFFHHGSMSFKAYDWSKEWTYFAVFQQALSQGQVPFHISQPFHYTHRFLGLPETLLSPQILLVPFLRVDHFILMNTLLLYSAGFVGLNWLRRRYRLGLLAFTALFLLFNFNGYITSHLAVGHSMWNGYFLLPFYVFFVLELIEAQVPARLTSLKLALVLFAMMLQGSFHMVIWCWLFLGLLVICNPRYWRAGLAALGWSGALCLFRLVPAAVTFWGFKEYTFISGYPSLADLFDALVIMKDHRAPQIGGMFGALGWWEYDVYVGLLGFAGLVYFGVYRRFDRSGALCAWRYAELDLPLLFMTVLSINYWYAFIAKLPIPLFNGERVASRFFIIPMVLLMVLAAMRMQRVLEAKRLTFKGQALIAVALGQLFFGLAMHSYLWRIGRLERDFRDEVISLNVDIVYLGDPLYKGAVIASALVSLAVLVAWVVTYITPTGCNPWAWNAFSWLSSSTPTRLPSRDP